MSRNIFLPPPGARIFSATSSPSHHRRRWSGVAPCIVPCQQLHLHLVATTPKRFLKRSKPCGCMVSTMDLSEARGLVLFRVVREGIGISQRLSATGTCAPTGDWDARPRTRAPQEPTGHHQQAQPEMELGCSTETLKRLAISVSQRRSFLPSSPESA